MENLAAEQAKITASVNNTNQLVSTLQKEIDGMKEFIINKVGRFVCKLGDAFVGKHKQSEQDRLRPLLFQFRRDMDGQPNKPAISASPQATKPPATTASPDESFSTDI